MNYFYMVLFFIHFFIQCIYIHSPLLLACFLLSISIFSNSEIDLEPLIKLDIRVVCFNIRVVMLKIRCFNFFLGTSVGVNM